MKLIKASFLATTILASAGAAHAATIATFNVSETGGTAFTTQLLNGTGVLDDSGVLTMNLTGTVSAGAFGTVNLTTTNTYTGSLAGNTFTATGGSSSINTCAGALCQYLALNVSVPFTSTSGSISLANGSTGTLNGSIFDASSGQTQTYVDALTVTSATPAVPVPAAAWLFGSGLLGLAGITRRRS